MERWDELYDVATWNTWVKIQFILLLGAHNNNCSWMRQNYPRFHHNSWYSESLLHGPWLCCRLLLFRLQYHLATNSISYAFFVSVSALQSGDPYTIANTSNTSALPCRKGPAGNQRAQQHDSCSPCGTRSCVFRCRCLGRMPPKAGERAKLLVELQKLHARSLSNLHVLVTSRREPDIEEVLTPLLTSPSMSLEGSEVDSDIQLHLAHQLATDTKLKKWSSELKSEIEDTLKNGANGM